MASNFNIIQDNKNNDNTSDDLDRAGLDPGIVILLKKLNFDTTKKILTTTPNELAQLTNLPINLIYHIISSVSRVAISGISLLKTTDLIGSIVERKLSLGCPILDDLLDGGLSNRGITEIYGESASGKTQICLQLCLTAQSLNSEGELDGKIIYICTEDLFPSKRLDEMIGFYKQAKPHLKSASFMDNVLISQIGNAENLLSCVCSKIESLINSFNVRLLVLDSVAAPFRCDYDVDQNVKRSLDIQKLGYTLHKLAQRYNLVIVCVNQVSDNIDNNKPWCRKIDGSLIPALGLVWTNLVTTRIQVARTQYSLKRYETRNGVKECEVPAPVCTMKVINSPNLPVSKTSYIVTSSGVVGIKL